MLLIGYERYFRTLCPQIYDIFVNKKSDAHFSMFRFGQFYRVSGILTVSILHDFASLRTVPH